jgi:hypothetical protein
MGWVRRSSGRGSASKREREEPPDEGVAANATTASVVHARKRAMRDPRTKGGRCRLMIRVAISDETHVRSRRSRTKAPHVLAFAQLHVSVLYGVDRL